MLDLRHNLVKVPNPAERARREREPDLIKVFPRVFLPPVRRALYPYHSGILRLYLRANAHRNPNTLSDYTAVCTAV